jgi:glycolate oxidase
LQHQEFIRSLQDIVGPEFVISHPEDLLVYEYDGSVDRSMPRAVVLPSTADQVSRVLALAFEAGVPVAGRGSGTGLSGGALAAPGGIQIAFPRMNRIVEVDTENRCATIEPGVINLDLDTHVRKFGMRYAPDPSSQKACSLGGNIAENAGGPHCLAYGTTTNHVLGMEVVLEDGTVVQLAGQAREVPGYDLRGVFVGSEGTFGIATRITVRLLPLPETVKTFFGHFPRH